MEEIRREVEQISQTQLHRRVPQPGGRDEVAQLARTMNGMLSRLDSAATQQRRFVSDASHELRSPVASIRQHTEVALSHPGRTSVPELAGTVLAEDLRMQRLVESLLLLARSDEGTLQGDRVPVDLDNAARHARERIWIGLGEAGPGSVVLRVDDDGAGIPAADRQRAFERFVRLDEARARDSGSSGLGLAIVADVVRSHGGTISVYDAPGGGARFEVRLPRAD